MRSRFIKANRFGLFGQAVVGALLVSGALPATAEPIDYIRDIRPIFAEHCTLCHGPDDAKGGLRLTDREAATSILKSRTGHRAG